MPDELIPLMKSATPASATSASSADSAGPRRFRITRVALIQAAVIVVGFVVIAGVLGGFLVERLWSPPDGMVYQHEWFRGLISLDPLTEAENADQGVFAGLGWYAAISCLGGLLLGALAAGLLASSELVTLPAVLVGGLAAGVVMRVVATALAPADPTALARHAADGTVFPDTLHLGPWWTITLVPGAALLALAAVFLLVTPRRRTVLAAPSSAPVPPPPPSSPPNQPPGPPVGAPKNPSNSG